mgnify:CR=1 FL=1
MQIINVVMQFKNSVHKIVSKQICDNKDSSTCIRGENKGHRVTVSSIHIAKQDTIMIITPI